MERLKPFHYYLLVLLLENGAVKMRWWHHKEFDRLKVFPYNGHKYIIDRNQIWTFHGWYPWLKETRNPWRRVYNMLYRWWYAVGYIRFQEPSDPLHGVEVPIPPLEYPKGDEKWTPAKMEALATTKIEDNYRKHVQYGSFRMSWKMWLVVGIFVLIMLMVFTGRIHI